MQRNEGCIIKRIIGRIAGFLGGTLGFIIKALGLLFFLFALSQIAIPLFAVAFKVVPSVTYTVIGILFFLYLLSKLRRVLKRRRFLRELRALCKERGVAFTLFGHPLWNALFRIHAGATMTKDGNTTELYFVPCLKKKTTVCLHADGSIVYHEAFRIRNATVFSWQHIYRFCEEPKRGSYVLLMPAPIKVYAAAIAPTCMADNGTVCGNYMIFTGGAFLRQMDRTL